MNKKSVPWTLFTFLLSCTVFYVIGCKKQDIKLSTTDDVNIVGYLEKNLDSFSLFKQILDRTEYSPFLNAYGAYTCFAPTNSGVTRWLGSIGAASVEAADLNLLKVVAKFHLLVDTVNTSMFKDGKLPVATMQGQYLITGVTLSGDNSSYNINRQASVTRSNVKVGNGLIHVIDNVLSPAITTIAKQLESNPDYSIFVQAMKETGYFDMLNTVDADTTRRWKTVIAESNRALADSGLSTYAALKARYSNTGNPANANDSLHTYMAYHILDGIKFLGDIITSPSHLTLQPQEVISVQLIKDSVLVNQDVFDEKLEPGILLLRNRSDNSATNGVWHTANAHFTAKIRQPTAVFWDVAAFDEIKKLAAYYKKQNYPFVRQSELDRPIKDINWEWNTNSATLQYEYSTSSSITQYAYNNDVLNLSLGSNRAQWIEFTTPVIIKGRYKVWVCYRARTGNPPQITANVRVNGELMQRPVNFQEFRPAGSDAELESLGWKRYTENPTSGNFHGRLVGIVDIKTTERHTFRLEPRTGGSNTNHLDMVHFIPIDENQYLPRFKPDGTKIYF